MEQNQSQNQNQNRLPSRFNEDHMKMIAEFYVANYEVMSRRINGSATGRNVNKERQRLLMQLTTELNARFGSHFTYQQVHLKLKNLKQSARLQIEQADIEGRPAIGGGADGPLLLVAEEIIIAKLLQVDEQRRAGTADGRSGQRRSRGIATSISTPFPPLNQTGSSSRRHYTGGMNSSYSPQSQRVVTTTADSEYSVNNQSYPGEDIMQVLPPRKRQRFSNGEPTVRDRETHYLKMTVLRLQKQVYENELELQAEKKVSVAKFGVAVDEFRRYVAEQRMASRGINLSAIPVDIPPGMEEVVGQL